MSHLPGFRFTKGAIKLAVVLLSLVAPLAFAQGADPIVGNFSDGFLTIQIAGQNGQYSGQFEAGGRTYAFTAVGNPQRIDGTYQDAGQLWQFSATLQGDTLTFQNASQTFQLTRVGGPTQQQATQPVAGQLPVGTRLTYSQAVSSNPGPNAGPDARMVGGRGYIQVDIHHSDSNSCIAYMTVFTSGLTAPTLTVSSSDHVVSEGTRCSDYWMSPAVLANYQAAPGGIESVERGPFQLGGQTYNTISINTVYQDMRSWRVYDLETGILLSFVEGKGDRSNLDGSSQGPSSSAVQELVNVRQVNLPWSSTTPLPAHLQNLQSLSYQGQMVQSMPGITMFDASTAMQMDMSFTVQQRSPTWLGAQANTNLSIMGSPLQPVQRLVVMNAHSGHFLLPSVIPQLRTGQVLDTDPVTGYTLSVQSADQNSVVLLTQGAGYRFTATFNATSGILLSSHLEAEEEGTLRTVTMELAGWQ